MSDSIKAAVGEVAKDVKDVVGEIVEQGIQSVTASPLTPQQISNLRIAEQQKQQQDQQDLVVARRKIEFYKKVDLEQKKVRQANQQKETQRIQAQQQEVQEKKVEKMQVHLAPKKPGITLPEEIARTRQEIGKGHGVGG